MPAPSVRLNRDRTEWALFTLSTIVTTTIILALAILAAAAGLIAPISIRETIVWCAIFALGGNLVKVAWRRRRRAA